MVQRFRELLRKKAVVLMYHRIAEPDTDPWQLSVSASNFEEQLQVLRASYNVVPVQSLIAQLANRSVDQGAVCITFDDGYSDNYLLAKPLLEKYSCPASFFIPSRFVSRNQQFWWDELEHIMLRKSRLPALLTVAINGQSCVFEPGIDAVLTPELRKKHAAWTWPDLPPTKRCDIYLDIWKRIRPLPFDEIEAVMRQIKAQIEPDTLLHEADFPMTAQQISDLVHNPLFDIGIHTITHPDLSSHSRSIQHREITVCAAYLQTSYKQAVHTIAYPYGSYNNDTLSIVKAQQLSAAFTTQEKFVTKHSDPFQLGRFHVKNRNGKEFEMEMKKWSRTLFR